jgi:outer membrane protein OmpA-like peptidoglycan-associated protein
MQATKPMEKGGFYLEILHPISVGGGFFSTLFKYWLIYAIIVAILGIIGYLTQCSEPAEPEKVELDQENFTFHNILFERDRSVILSGSESDLQEAYKILNDYPDISVIIVGHSSKDNETSNVEYNRKLSLERAEAVKQWLADKGISEDRMQSEGRGFDDPVASNETESGKKKNRRIEFVVK